MYNDVNVNHIYIKTVGYVSVCFPGIRNISCRRPRPKYLAGLVKH
jgi:hypothetical protein